MLCAAASAAGGPAWPMAPCGALAHAGRMRGRETGNIAPSNYYMNQTDTRKENRKHRALKLLYDFRQKLPY